MQWGQWSRLRRGVNNSREQISDPSPGTHGNGDHLRYDKSFQAGSILSRGAGDAYNPHCGQKDKMVMCQMGLMVPDVPKKDLGILAGGCQGMEGGGVDLG